MLLNTGKFSSSLSSFASYFSVPSLGSLYYKDPDNTTFKGAVMAAFKTIMDMFQIGIPVYPDKYEERGGNEIGQQVLVGAIGSEIKDAEQVAGALSRIADNIVVNPKVWVIHGYSGIQTDNIVGSAMNAPVTAIPIPALSSFIKQFGRNALLEVFKRVLRYLCDARRPFRFTTAEGETVPALIKSYSVKQVPENQNWVELDLEIQEFRYLSLKSDGNQIAEGLSGDIDAMGAIQQVGRTALKVLAI